MRTAMDMDNTSVLFQTQFSFCGNDFNVSQQHPSVNG